MFKKTKDFLKNQITQGSRPEALAWACTAGILIGNIPVLGATTFICTLVAILFRLNQPVIQGINQLMWFTQIPLIPLFLRLGEWLTGAPPVALNPQKVIEDFSQDMGQFFIDYGMAGVHSLLGWALVAPWVGFIVYHVLIRFFRKWSKGSSQDR
jgi:uncharacterized protein (DUF2062 family)